MTKRRPDMPIPTGREYMIMVIVVLAVVMTVLLINFFVGPTQ